MSESQLLAPCSFSRDPYELCTVDCVETNFHEFWMVDDIDRDIDQNVSNKLNALQGYFQRKCADALPARIIDIRPLENGTDRGAVTLDNHTPSVFLAIFLKATQTILNRKFRNSWDFIIATGDINPYDGTIEPKAVSDIKEKFEAVKAHAEKFPGKKHLFLYVHGDDKAAIKRGWYNDTIEIIAFSPGCSINVILACVFEPSFNDEQKTLLDKATVSTAWDYVSTPEFEEMKQEALSEDWKGYFIFGEGESGKTATAIALAKYLMETECIYAPIFVFIRNEALFSVNPIAKDVYDPITDYIASGIRDFLGLDWKPEFGLELLRQALKKRYLLVIDNLERDKADQVLIAVKNIISGCDPKTKPPLILTSQFKCNNAKPWQDLGLKTKQAPSLTKEHVEELMYRVAAGNSFEENLRRDDVEYQNLTEKIYGYYGPGPLPGLITRIVPSLENEEPAQVLRKLSDFNWHSSSHYSVVFSQMKPFTQAVLFAFIGLGYCDYSSPSISRELTLLIKNSGWSDDGIVPREWQLESKIDGALGDLLRSNLVYRRGNEYFIKTHTYTAFMFHPDLKGKMQPNGLSTRETLVKTTDMIFAGLGHNQNADTISDLLAKLKKEKKDIHQYHLMHFVAQQGDKPEYIDLLIDYGFDINKRWKKYTPLHFAAEFNENINVVKRLLEKGADIYAKTEYGHTVLHLAAYNRNTDVMKLLIEQDRNLVNVINPNTVQEDMDSNEVIPRGISVLKPKEPEISLKQGMPAVEIDGKSLYSFVDYLAQEVSKGGRHTPLHIAAFRDDTFEAIRILVDNGADINSKDHSGETPLHIMAKKLDPNMIELLLEKGASINAKTKDKETPLLIAAQKNTNPAVIQLLIDRGAYIYAKDSSGANLLHYAALNENPEIFTMVLNMGFDINSTDYDGQTMLHHAVMNQNPAVLVMLLDMGMNIEAKNKLGLNILDWAVRVNRENPAVTKILLEKGANINAKNKYGTTPLIDAAIENPNPEIAITLIKAGASLREKDNEGKTALYYLKERGDWPVIEKAIKEAGIRL